MLEKVGLESVVSSLRNSNQVRALRSELPVLIQKAKSVRAKMKTV